MKLFAAAFLLFSPLAFAQTNGPDQTQVQFGLNQPTQVLNLSKKEFETIYRTDQVADTCYRSEVQGTRNECHTEYDRQCHTENRNVCQTRSYPVCQRVPRNVCHTEQVCRTEMDRVCNSNGCTNVPRRVCRNENRCSTQMDSVCHNEQRTECQNIPQQVCQNIPRQACQQVPNVVQVPYACTRPVQVPVGQQLKLDTHAVVTVNFANMGEVGNLNDSFFCNLVGDQVAVRLAAPSQATLYQATQTRTEQMVSATEKLISINMNIQANSIQKMNDFLKLSISDMKFFSDRLEFGFLGSFNVPFKGHLNVSKRGAGVVIDSDFGSRAIVSQGNRNVIMFNSLGAPPLEYKSHSVNLSLGIDVNALRAGAINPEALNLISNQTIQNGVSGYPYR